MDVVLTRGRVLVRRHLDLDPRVEVTLPCRMFAGQESPFPAELMQQLFSGPHPCSGEGDDIDSTIVRLPFLLFVTERHAKILCSCDCHPKTEEK